MVQETYANEKDNVEATLEEKVGVFGRLKYVAIPSAITVVSYFTPELKRSYNALPGETQKKLRNAALIGTGVAGIAATIFSGYKLYRSHKGSDV